MAAILPLALDVATLERVILRPEEKMQAYMRNEVELGWLIDPQSKTVTIYSADRQLPSELVDPDRVTGEGPVAGFLLELKQIYDQL
ncbi:MAG: Uma2 family endonuclease [Acidobacteriaceae bacterium]|nr:Uma2 family endonuclease [Acidobacteriaceae bacterium]MBV9780751.1 Uma2 family endonuclease [Acidobacteriaceae bacterium]